MKNILSLKKLILLFAFLSITAALSATECTIKKTAEFPAAGGHTGVAGAFVGNIDNMVIFAGGSDFPDGAPWEKGVKKYYDDVYLYDGKACVKAEGKLPVALGNGCAASVGKQIFCFGGNNSARASSAVYCIKLNGKAVKIDSVAALPVNFKAAACVSHKNEIYVHGTEEGANVLYRFSPSSLTWKALESCPDRTISEGCNLVYQHNGREEAIYLIGGRGYDSDGLYISSKMWVYLPVQNKWEAKTDISIDGEAAPLMYATAVQYGSSHILVFGGDDGKEFVRRAGLEKEIAATSDKDEKEALQKELASAFTGHQGFSSKVLAYHTITDTWIVLEEFGNGLPAVTTAVKAGDKVIIPCGEAKPGVREGGIYEIKIRDEVKFGWVNYTVLVIYLLGMLGIGFYFSKKTKNTEQFFKGGSRIPWWAAGISIFATALSAITFLSIPAKAYMADWGMFMFNMTIIMIVPVIIHFYLPFFRKLNVASAYQYLEERFSSPVRYLASLFFCLFMFARVAIVLFLPSLALNAVTGLNIYLCIIFMGLVTIIYCTMGGIEAVVWGDVVQGIILVGGAVVALVWLVLGVDGGAGKVMEIALDEQKFNILDFSFDWTKPVFWVTVFGGLANQLLTYSSDQSVVQRYITVKDTAGTKKGLWLNGILSIPIALIFFSIGTGLYAFFKTHPEMLNVGMSNTDSIFPHYIMCDIPAGIAGLIIAAIFAAAMSTLSSNINSTSTVMTEDFYSKFFPGVSDKKKMSFARWTGVILGLFGIVMAIVLATTDIASLWDQFNFFLGLLTSGVGGLFMMGIFTKRIGTRSALTGFAGSIIILLACKGYSHVSVTLYGFIGLVSSFVIAYLTSFIYGYRK